jgi:hypothetical protein
MKKHATFSEGVPQILWEDISGKNAQQLLQNWSDQMAAMM